MARRKNLDLPKHRGPTKLTPTEVLYIFHSPRPGIELARLYEVTEALVSFIRSGRRHSYITRAKNRDAQRYQKIKEGTES